METISFDPPVELEVRNLQISLNHETSANNQVRSNNTIEPIWQRTGLLMQHRMHGARRYGVGADTPPAPIVDNL